MHEFNKIHRELNSSAFLNDASSVVVNEYIFLYTNDKFFYEEVINVYESIQKDLDTAKLSNAYNIMLIITTEFNEKTITTTEYTKKRKNKKFLQFLEHNISFILQTRGKNSEYDNLLSYLQSIEQKDHDQPFFSEILFNFRFSEHSIKNLGFLYYKSIEQSKILKEIYFEVCSFDDELEINCGLSSSV